MGLIESGVVEQRPPSLRSVGDVSKMLAKLKTKTLFVEHVMTFRDATTFVPIDDSVSFEWISFKVERLRVG